MHWIILKEVNTVEKNKTSKLNDIEIYILYIIIKREAQRAKCLKKKKKSDQSLSDLWDNIKQSKTWVKKIPEGVEREEHKIFE